MPEVTALGLAVRVPVAVAAGVAEGLQVAETVCGGLSDGGAVPDAVVVTDPAGLAVGVRVAAPVPLRVPVGEGEGGMVRVNGAVAVGVAEPVVVAAGVGVTGGEQVCDLVADGECVVVPHAVRVGPLVSVGVVVHAADGVPVRVLGTDGEGVEL